MAFHSKSSQIHRDRSTDIVSSEFEQEDHLFAKEVHVLTSSLSAKRRIDKAYS